MSVLKIYLSLPDFLILLKVRLLAIRRKAVLRRRFYFYRTRAINNKQQALFAFCFCILNENYFLWPCNHGELVK